jgi:hypothetical protein
MPWLPGSQVPPGASGPQQVRTQTALSVADLCFAVLRGSCQVELPPSAGRSLLFCEPTGFQFAALLDNLNELHTIKIVSYASKAQRHAVVTVGASAGGSGSR